MTQTPLKADLRKAALARRAAIEPAARAAAARAVVGRGLAVAGGAAATTAALYMPMRGELDCLPLLEALAEAGWQTALPCTPARGRLLIFRRWRPGAALTPGRFGAGEPAPENPPVAPAIVFAPLAAFDRAGGRIGYGGGYYDATMAALAAAGPRPLYAGLAFAAQEVAEIPAEPHDASLDFVLTEAETISCAGA
jgi:5-formyltetrahydrofolate cyclo-ligase